MYDVRLNNKTEIAMNDTTSKSTRLVVTLRWLARVIGTLSLVVFLFFFVADCIGKGKIAVESDRILMTVSLFITFIGLVIAWKWEGIGGTTALVGLIGFNIFDPAIDRGTFVVTGLYGLPTIIFLFCWWRTRKQVSTEAT